eukprot:c23230_g1_i1 orf=397-1050(-)
MGTLNQTERAHRLYREGQYEDALQLYTDALSAANHNAHRIALHSNRAACFLKLHDFRKAVEECSAVLELDPNHTGALMLRAQTLVAVKDYHFALFDVTRLIEINPSSEVYLSLQARLRTQLSLAPIPEAEDEGLAEMEECTIEISSIGTLNSPAFPSKTQMPSAHNGWEAIPKPRGHSGLDYSHWDTIGNNLSDDEDEDSQPQFKFRLKTIDLRAVE